MDGKKTNARRPSKSSKKSSRSAKRNEAITPEVLPADDELLDSEPQEPLIAEDDEGQDPDDLLLDDDGASELDDSIDGDGSLDDIKALSTGVHDPSLLPKVAESHAIRPRENLQIYLREISRFPMLEPEEELELARRVCKDGDPDAAFKLVSSHLRLVVRIAMDFQRRWMQNVLDLIQEGNVGLVRAVSKFDPEKGIKFSYYAAFWIKAYILKFIMDNWRMVKIGTTQAQRKLFYNLNKERQSLIAQGFDPDASMLSKNLNVTEEQIVEMQQRMDASDMSLNLPVNSDEPGGATRMDFLPALGPGIEETLADHEIASMVQDKLQTLRPKLSDKEEFILDHRLLTDDPVTLREIGEQYGITRERVRQIEARLMQKIRDHLFAHIKDFSQDWINRHE